MDESLWTMLNGYPKTVPNCTYDTRIKIPNDHLNCVGTLVYPSPLCGFHAVRHFLCHDFRVLNHPFYYSILYRSTEALPCDRIWSANSITQERKVGVTEKGSTERKGNKEKSCRSRWSMFHTFKTKGCLHLGQTFSVSILVWTAKKEKTF